VLGHGFLSSKARHVNQGRHLATRGFIVVIPTFKGGADHSRNADDMRVLVSWMLYLGTAAGSPFQGTVRADRIATTGHSAGGLSAILAAARDARIVATFPMDPVDVGSLGTTALAAMPRKAIGMAWSEPSACNAFGSAVALFTAAKAPKFGVRIIGATHTDPMDPADVLSQAVCGAAAPARQALYRKYVTAWLEFVLHGDARYDPRPLAAADAAANRVQAFDSLF
jgi:predicted dienelactone hydrolase